MADILRRQLAPVTDEAWAEIDDQATTILKGNLSARAIVDMDGPSGLTMGAVNLGGVAPGKASPVKGVDWGTRQVLPLIETRVPFSLDLSDLDSVSRGGKTPELGPVVDAARKAALFEETAIYKGFSAAGITGILEASPHKAVTLSKSAGTFPKAVEAGIHCIQSAGIGGPFELVLDRASYQMLNVGDEKGYPLRQRITQLLGGNIHWSPAVKGGVILSARGGDFELTVGQDLSIGYTGSDADSVKLFVTESFTFRVLEPEAAVALKPAS